MTKLLSKLGLSIGTMSGVFFIEATPTHVNTTVKQKDVKLKIEEINSIEDIELFEKVHGCTFGFIKDLEKAKYIYTAREYLRRWKGEDDRLTEKIIFGANIKHTDQKNDDAKKLCKESKSVVNLFEDGGAFRLGAPYGGW